MSEGMKNSSIMQIKLDQNQEKIAYFAIKNIHQLQYYEFNENVKKQKIISLLMGNKGYSQTNWNSLIKCQR